MPGQILTDWSAEKAAAFGKRPILARHNVHERALFSDDGLVDLLDRYPRHAFNIYTMDYGPDGRRENFRKGHAGDLGGAEILEAVQRGRLWVNLRAANTHLPEYEALCEEMFGELDARTPGLRTFRRDLGVLISSPNARVFYHVDIPMVTLWQIRGEKTAYVYPTGAPFVRDEQVEAIVLREKEEEIDYDPAFDADAEVFKLTPGLMATWPQTAPHRVDNSDCVNVSLSCEFMTWPALVHANALYANGVLRRRHGRSPEIAKHGVTEKYAKAALARGLKLVGSRSSFERKVEPSFIVDLGAERCVREMSAA